MFPLVVLRRTIDLKLVPCIVKVLYIKLHVKQGENGKPGALSSPLGVPPRGDLPYVMLAKAIVSGIVCLQQQMEAYSKLDGSITGNFEIPEAVPRKVGS